jgi:hypothetical protein
MIWLFSAGVLSQSKGQKQRPRDYCFIRAFSLDFFRVSLPQANAH